MTTARSSIHGHARRKEFTGEYNTWRGMLERCYNEKSIGYPYYGERGITVCDRWRESAAAFLEDMGPKPSPQHTIDRRKNDQGYSPENCYWATKTEQAQNRRANERGAEVTQFTVYARKRKALHRLSLHINLLEPRVPVVDDPYDAMTSQIPDDGCWV